MDRLLREVRFALRRRKREESFARRALAEQMNCEMRETLTAMLLCCELAVSRPNVPRLAAEKIRTIDNLARELRLRLEVTEKRRFCQKWACVDLPRASLRKHRESTARRRNDRAARLTKQISGAPQSGPAGCGRSGDNFMRLGCVARTLAVMIAASIPAAWGQAEIDPDHLRRAQSGSRGRAERQPTRQDCDRSLSRLLPPALCSAMPRSEVASGQVFTNTPV